jgi:hypothetical protein
MKSRRFCVLSPCPRSGVRELLSQIDHDPTHKRTYSV